MFKFIESKWWFLFVFMFIMPLDGIIFTNKPLVGLFLILCQIPYCIIIMEIISGIKNEKK